jgi:hypothetical protein
MTNATTSSQQRAVSPTTLPECNLHSRLPACLNPPSNLHFYAPKTYTMAITWSRYTFHSKNVELYTLMYIIVLHIGLCCTTEYRFVVVCNAGGGGRQRRDSCFHPAAKAVQHENSYYKNGSVTKYRDKQCENNMPKISRLINFGTGRVTRTQKTHSSSPGWLLVFRVCPQSVQAHDKTTTYSWITIPSCVTQPARKISGKKRCQNALRTIFLETGANVQHISNV